MANSLSAVQRQHYRNELQENLMKDLLCFTLGKGVISEIPNGTQLNVPRASYSPVRQYTPGVPTVQSDVNTAVDVLNINESPYITFDIDDQEQEDNYINMVSANIPLVTYKVREYIDGKFFAQYVNASNTYNSNGLNGAGTTPVALTTGVGTENVSDTFGIPYALLANSGAKKDRLCLIVDSFVLSTIRKLGLNTGFQVADELYHKAFRGDFLGMMVYESGDLTATTTMVLSATPTNNDTVRYGGQVFTFVTTLGTTPGNVLIGASATTARDNLIAAINGAAGAGSTYVEIGFDRRAAFAQGITATANGAAVNFVSNRGRQFPLASNATNKFGAETINCMVMEKDSIMIALRKNVFMDEIRLESQFATRTRVRARFGLLTPQQGKDRMVSIAVQATPAQ